MMTSKQLKEIKSKKLSRGSLMMLFTEDAKANSVSELPVINSEVVTISVGLKKTLKKIIKREKDSVEFTKEILVYSNNGELDITYSKDYATCKIDSLHKDGNIRVKNIGDNSIRTYETSSLSYDLLIVIFEAIEKDKFI